MKLSTKALFDKITRLIDTSDERHKRIIERYISLTKARLHEMISAGADNHADILAAHRRTVQHFNREFGSLDRQSEPIRG